jgi:hypothetical protein
MHRRRMILAGCALILVAMLGVGCQAPNRAVLASAEMAASPTATASAASPAPTATSTATATATPSRTPTSTPGTTPGTTTSGATSGTTSATPAPTGSPASSASASRPEGSTTRAAAEPTPAAAPVAAGGVAPRRPAANAASAGFAAPSPKYVVSPPNSGGVSRMVAPKFGIDHYIDVLGIIDNQMESPDHDGSYAVGWYPIFGAPGVPGNAVFSAHETWNHLQGPFYFMYLAAIGDRISIDMADGRRFTYEVISTARYTVDTIPMVEVLYPSTRGEHEQWITLITCGGEIVYGANGFGDYIDRDIVHARRIS